MRNIITYKAILEKVMEIWKKGVQSRKSPNDANLHVTAIGHTAACSRQLDRRSAWRKSMERKNHKL